MAFYANTALERIAKALESLVAILETLAATEKARKESES